MSRRSCPEYAVHSAAAGAGVKPTTVKRKVASVAPAAKPGDSVEILDLA